MRRFLFIIAMVLAAAFASATGSFYTSTLSPAVIDICGPYAQYSTITASGIINQENFTLSSVTATLVMPAASGLSFLTSRSISLGSISASSSSSVAPAWTLQCNAPSAGTYVAYVNYSSAEGYGGSSNGETVVIIRVHDLGSFYGNISLIDTVNSGSEASVTISDTTPTIYVTTSRDSVCRGSIDSDEEYELMDFIMAGTSLQHNHTVMYPLTEGSHKAYVRCRDNFGNTMQSPIVINFVIDSLPPLMTVQSPQATVSGDIAELKITASEDSECRYSSSDKPYADMKKFDADSGRLFSQRIDDLEEDAYTYYVRCRDMMGNEGVKEINFEVIIPPTAKIFLEKESPIAKGTYEVTLLASKTLRTVPQLHYRYTDDDEFKRDINLVKDGSYYKGYIIIDDQTAVRSGLFVFKGYDLLGHEGTEITEGAAFLVDTLQPEAPGDITVFADTLGNRLEWYYSGERPDQFNVYRSTSAGVGPIHIYKKTGEQKFTDTSLSANQIYYYRVAAVDSAGNVGLLSKEVSVYAKVGMTSEPEIETANPPTKETRDWKLKVEKDIESLLIDIDYAVSNLDQQSMQETAVDELGLKKKAADAKQEVEKLKAQISGLDVLRITDAELRDILSKADALIARTEQTLPQSLETLKSSSTIQSLSDDDVSLAVDELLMYNKANYSESQIKSYKNTMGTLNKAVKVEIEVNSIRITFLSGGTESQVSVKKRFSYESTDPIDNVIAVEVIPKTVAGHVSSIDIRTPGSMVIKEDPVLGWGFDRLGFDRQTISYYILSDDDSESAKTSKLVVLKDPSIAIREKAGMLTGFSIFWQDGKGTPAIGIILGFLIIAGLLTYYVVTVSDIKISDFTSKFASMTNIKLPKARISRKAAEDADALSQRYGAEFQMDSPLTALPSKYFHVRNGDVIRSIVELPSVLKAMDELAFNYHVQGMQNDFADWVEKTYGASDLASVMREIKTKEEMIGLLDRIIR
jgi:fibronectin type 3 domain-containing protein